MKSTIISWKAVFIGFILAIVLGIVLKAIAGTMGLFLGVITAGVIVGYTVNNDIINSTVHGALIGVIGGIISEIFILIANVTIGKVGVLITINGIIAVMESIVTWAILGMMGSAIGATITKRSSKMGFIGETTSKVSLNMENIQKCACSRCPVQVESVCAQNKMNNMQEMMKMEKDIVPKPENVPKMYCATGIATCGDIDTSKTCNCPNCSIWKENNLAQGDIRGYFCKNEYENAK